MSLYRKYRPQSFVDLLGQSHVTEVLESALKKDLVSHAYFFTGPRGTGKTSTARILARALNCLGNSEKKPCNECEMCQSALDERLTDLIEIDAASHGLVDDARALVEQAKFLPTQGKKKIYIIDEVHMLSKSAFNALLKIVEEPPQHVHFILATTEAHKVLDTIKSRCQRFDFHLADQSLIINRLSTVCEAEKIQGDDEGLALIAEHARGSFRDALSLLEQFVGSPTFTVQDVRNVLGLSELESAQSFLMSLLSQDRQKALDIIHEVYHQGHDLYQFCTSILQLLRKSLIESSNKSSFPLEWIDHFFCALDQLRDPLLPQLALELAVFKCLPHSSSQQQQKPAIEEVSVEPAQEKEFQAPILETDSEELPAQKEEQPSSSPDFKSSEFLSHLDQPSLKALLKISQLSYRPGELKISVRSQFELDKLKESEHHQLILQTLQTHTGRDESIAFELNPDAFSSPSNEGLSSSDLESVF